MTYKKFFLLIFLLFPFLLFSQVKIKERVQINPNLPNSKPAGNGILTDSVWFDGCYYDISDSSLYQMTFEPNRIAPGETSIITIDFQPNSEVVLDTMIIYPQLGELFKLPSGKFEYTAPDTISSDSLGISFNYINFTRSCAGIKLNKNDTILFNIPTKETDNITGCISCLPFLRALHKHYASGQLEIGYDSLSVTISPDTLYPGDTANVVIKKRNPDGTLTDFDSTQTFEVAKLEGCIFGNILVDDSLSSYFYGVHQPIKFLVDTSVSVIDTLVSDTGRVLLRVGLVDPNQKQKKLQPNDVTDCFTGSFISGLYDNASSTILNPLEIISPVPGDTNWITSEPKMPSIICKARINNFVSGGIEYDWKFYVNYKLYRHAYKTNTTYCERTGEIKLTGTTYGIDYDLATWTVPFNISNLNSAEFKGKHYFQDGGCNAVINNWYEGNNIFIGGYVLVEVTAISQSTGKKLGFAQRLGGVILGRNPDSQQVKTYANTPELKAIIKNESLVGHHRWRQFNEQDINLYYSSFGDTLRGSTYNRKGYPVYGVPNGFGVAKIDNSPSPTEMDLWNWQHNVDSGRDHLDKDKTAETNFERAEGSTNSDKYYWMNVFQFYNSGIDITLRYWKWYPKKKEWKLNQNRLNDYAKTVYDFYKSFNQ